MLSYIAHKMIKGDIVLDKPFVVRILYLQLFRDTGAYEGKAVLHAHVFPRVYRSTHERALHGEKLRKKLGEIALDIGNDCGTGLRDASLEIVFSDIVQVPPGADIGTEGDAYDTADTKFLKPAEDTLIFIRIICLKCRRKEKRYLLSCRQICKESLSVIIKLTRSVDADIDAAAAGDTLAAVDLDPRPAVLLPGDTGTHCAADVNALIAAYTVIIGMYYTGLHILTIILPAILKVKLIRCVGMTHRVLIKVNVSLLITILMVYNLFVVYYSL